LLGSTEFARSASIYINTKNRKKKEETLTERLKRSPDESHTQTHGSLIEMF
jgi:hypothetical protein